MYGGSRRLRYIIGFGLTIALLLLVIILIVNHGNNKGNVPVTQKALTSYATDDNAAVRETVDGQINSPEDHNELQITISNSETSFELMKGYEGNVTTSEAYPMSTTSFEIFLSALEHAGFTKGNDAANDQNDRGYCPEGQRYIFEVMDNGKDVERFWSTSCGTPKTFAGNTGLVLGLFQAQVPDYDTLINNYSNSADFDFHL